MAYEIGQIVKIDPNAEVNKGHVSERMKLCIEHSLELTITKLFVENGSSYAGVKYRLNNQDRDMILYTSRLMLVKREIVEQCFVRCVDPRRSSVLVKGTVYLVTAMSEKDGKTLVRVRTNRREIRHAFPVEMFEFSSMLVPKDWDKIVVENDEEKLLDELAQGEHRGVCSFAIMNDNGKKHIVKDGPCHAAFGYDYGDEAKKPIKAIALCFSRFYNNYDEQKKEGYKRFLNYIVNESPMKDCFLPRSPEDMVKNGVLMNVNKSSSELAVAAVATRHYTEFAAKGNVFDEVMDMGFEGSVAMFVSTFFNKNGDELTYNNFGGGHGFMANVQDYKSLFSFFKNGFDPELLPNPYKPMAEGRKGYKILRTVAKLSAPNEYDVGPGAVVDYVKKLKGFEAGAGGVMGGRGVLKMTGKNSLIRLCAAVSKEV